MLRGCYVETVPVEYRLYSPIIVPNTKWRERKLQPVVETRGVEPLHIGLAPPHRV